LTETNKVNANKKSFPKMFYIYVIIFFASLKDTTIFFV